MAKRLSDKARGILAERFIGSGFQGSFVQYCEQNGAEFLADDKQITFEDLMKGVGDESAGVECDSTH